MLDLHLFLLHKRCTFLIIIISINNDSNNSNNNARPNREML